MNHNTCGGRKIHFAISNLSNYFFWSDNIHSVVYYGIMNADVFIGYIF